MRPGLGQWARYWHKPHAEDLQKVELCFEFPILDGMCGWQGTIQPSPPFLDVQAVSPRCTKAGPMYSYSWVDHSNIYLLNT